jgi:hypothetical protein
MKRSEIKLSRSKRRLKNRAAALHKPLYAQEITGLSRAPAKHLFAKEVAIVRFASLCLVMKLLFFEWR